MYIYSFPGLRGLGTRLQHVGSSNSI